MNAGGDDLAIRKGVEAAERWPDFARDSMEAQFDAVRRIGDQATLTPPAVPQDSAWSVLNAIVAGGGTAVARDGTLVGRRALDDARWFGVPVPPDVAVIAVKGEEED